MELSPGPSEHSVLLSCLMLWIRWVSDMAVWDLEHSDSDHLGIMSKLISSEDIFVVGLWQVVVRSLVAPSCGVSEGNVGVLQVLWDIDSNDMGPDGSLRSNSFLLIEPLLGGHIQEMDLTTVERLD